MLMNHSHMMILVVTRVASFLHQVPASATPNLGYFPNVAAFSSSAAFLEWAYILTDRMRNISIIFSIIMFIRMSLSHISTYHRPEQNS